MRTKQFGDFTIKITEKQYKQLKKRFNPENFTPTLLSLDGFTIQASYSHCICYDVRDPMSCAGCPFDLYSIGKLGACSYMLNKWARENHFADPHEALKLQDSFVSVHTKDGMKLIQAIYDELLTWKKVKGGLMQYEQFLDNAIDVVIEECKKRHQPAYQGEIARTLASCRRKDPETLNNVLLQANADYLDSLSNIDKDANLRIRIVREIEWLCNIVSAFLASEGESPILTPNAAGTQMKDKIIRKDIDSKRKHI